MDVNVIEVLNSGGIVVVLGLIIQLLATGKLVPAASLEAIVALVVKEVLRALSEEVKPG